MHMCENYRPYILRQLAHSWSLHLASPLIPYKRGEGSSDIIIQKAFTSNHSPSSASQIHSHSCCLFDSTHHSVMYSLLPVQSLTHCAGLLFMQDFPTMLSLAWHIVFSTSGTMTCTSNVTRDLIHSFNGLDVSIYLYPAQCWIIKISSIDAEWSTVIIFIYFMMFRKIPNTLWDL